MLFNSLNFLLFFIVVYGTYLTLSHRFQNYFLLLASWFFYSCWDYRFLFLLLFSTVMDFGFGLALERLTHDGRRKTVMVLSICLNLGILGFFKYFNFFSDGAVAILRTIGVQTTVPTMEIALPIGISFYTFHNMSYVIDVYRGVIKPTRSFVNFALYTAFFPQLVAGPIARPAHLLPQVERPRQISLAMVREGFWLILLGYFKKVVLADNMAAFSKPVFDHPGEASGLWALLGIYAFAFQIYGDFSGYSDIARGLSKLMGFELILNFRHPYFATNPRDFWSRWHISLSTWLRDYLYIPLGGNRHGSWKTYRNLFLTMLIGGLWHGAAWHYVAWGTYHGFLLASYRMVGERTESKSSSKFSGWKKIGSWATPIFYFHLTCLGWLLFGVQRLRDAPVLLHNIFGKFFINPHLLDAKIVTVSLLLFAGPVIVLEWLEERTQLLPIVPYWPRLARLGCYAFIVAFIVLCGAVEKKEFMYFQF